MNCTRLILNLPKFTSEILIVLLYVLSPDLSYLCQGSALSTNEESESDVDGLGLESFAGISVQLAEGGPMVTLFFCIASFV